MESLFIVKIESMLVRARNSFICFCKSQSKITGVEMTAVFESLSAQKSAGQGSVAVEPMSLEKYDY